MLEENKSNVIDNVLLEHFKQEIWSKVPHVEEKAEGAQVVNATPLIDLTGDLKECAKEVYGLDLTEKNFRIFGKLDSSLLAGSIKVRPAVHILHDAIVTGKLKGGQTVIEATSGNFGIALGEAAKLGLKVVTLVSRKLQEGVFEELRNEKVHIINLDMDICPAPGMKVSPNILAAKAAASNIRSQLSELGFDPSVFDKYSSEIEDVLAKQDIINLAKLLAKIYGWFCPEQYDNALNVEAHRTVTAAELDQQLFQYRTSLGEFEILCTFGTGGTSGGLSRYMKDKYGKKGVHVVFPLGEQDVAGIRTRSKASGLKFYEPDIYAGQHEVDFKQAKRLLKFFVDKGHDIGESSALALYAAMQMVNFDGRGNFVVMIADGIQKYKKNLEEADKDVGAMEVSIEDAVSKVKDYNNVLWIHTQFTPREEGIELIANSLGVDKSKIVVPTARQVEQILATKEIPKELNKEFGGPGAKPLLVCMAGNTSLMVARVLASKGIKAQSLTGGISILSQEKGKQISELVQMATE